MFNFHTITFNYPINPTNNDKKKFYNYFNSLQNVLPCRYCRENYSKNIKKPGNTKLTFGVMKDRNSISRWLYNLHEMINKNLGKESGLTYDMVRDRYENFRARCLSAEKKKS